MLIQLEIYYYTIQVMLTLTYTQSYMSSFSLQLFPYYSPAYWTQAYLQLSLPLSLQGREVSHCLLPSSKHYNTYC